MIPSPERVNNNVKNRLVQSFEELFSLIYSLWRSNRKFLCLGVCGTSPHSVGLRG